MHQDHWSEAELCVLCGVDRSSGDDSTPSSPPSPTTAADLLAWEQVRDSSCSMVHR